MANIIKFASTTTGNLFVLRDDGVVFQKVADLDGTPGYKEMPKLSGENGAIEDVCAGPDGTVYVMNEEGRIFKSGAKRDGTFKWVRLLAAPGTVGAAD